LPGLIFIGLNKKYKKMTDIFNNKILCGKCEVQMKPINLAKNGFVLRAVMCPKCNSKVIHPKDEQEYKNFIELKKKEYNVKMRMVGNSYAVSIPREIVEFMQEQENLMNKMNSMNNMVRLCFEEAGRIRLDFDSNNQEKPRTVSSEEVRVVKNGKPVYHVKRVSDSANPDKNKTKVFKAKKGDRYH
jgi:hypothetical protein